MDMNKDMEGKMMKCEACGAMVPADKMKMVHGKNVCMACAEKMEGMADKKM
jgi:formylmethanofuran dehydrogenase subunit E